MSQLEKAKQLHHETQASLAQFIGLAPYPDREDGYAKRTAEGFGVQAWSQGPLYPCVIAVIERYDDQPYDYLGFVRDLEHRLRSRSFELTLDGHSEEYASYADAEQVARALLASSAVRYQWSKGEL